MLDLYVVFRCSRRITHSLILLTTIATSSLHSSQFWENELKPAQHFEHEWITRYFESIDNDTEIGEVIDFLIAVRQAFLARGYECPSLLESAICLSECLTQKGIKFDEVEIQRLYEEIYAREQLVNLKACNLTFGHHYQAFIQTCKHKHKNKEDKKELKMGSKSVFGLLKVIAGGLMCVIPVPAIQLAGGALVADGIKDMIDDARETGDENERQQKLDELRRQEAQILNPQQGNSF